MRLIELFRADLSYTSVLGPNKKHLSQMVDKLSRRSLFFRVAGACLLCCSLVLVLAGVIVFLWPSRFADVIANSESRTRLSELQDEEVELLSESGNVESGLEKQRLLVHSLLDLKDLQSLISDATPEMIEDWPAHGEVGGCTTRAHLSARALAAADPPLLTLSHDRLLFSYSSNIGTGVVDVPRELLLLLQEKYSINTMEMEELGARIDAFKIALADDDRQVKRHLANALVADLDNVAKAFDSAKHDFDTLLRESSESTLKGGKRKERLHSIRNQIASLEDVLEAQQINETFWDRWIPTLTVRLGIVILLLFLTKILLSTYRYLISMGAYFSARSDALQLISAMKQPELDEYEKLVRLLSPDDHKVEAVVAPDEVLAASLATALKKIPG